MSRTTRRFHKLRYSRSLSALSLRPEPNRWTCLSWPPSHPCTCTPRPYLSIGPFSNSNSRFQGPCTAIPRRNPLSYPSIATIAASRSIKKGREDEKGPRAHFRFVLGIHSPQPNPHSNPQPAVQSTVGTPCPGPQPTSPCEVACEGFPVSALLFFPSRSNQAGISAALLISRQIGGL